MNGGYLLNLTLFTTFLCFGFSLWFAIYLLARNRSNQLTFRAVVALIAMAFYYNYTLYALLNAASPNDQIRSLAISIALIAWHDLTHYLLNKQQRKKYYPLARGIVMFGVLVIILTFTAPPSGACPPAYTCPASLRFPWSIINLFYVFVYSAILYNLWLIKRTEGLLPNMAFYLAVLLGSGTILYGAIGALVQLPVPRLPANLLVLSSFSLLAYSIAHDRTFVTQRTALYDLPVTLFTISLIVVVYLLAGRSFKLQSDQLILIAFLAIFSHSAYDLVRDFLNRSVNRHERRVRQELQTLRHDVSAGDTVDRYLNRGLAILCYNLRASSGFVAVRKAGQYVVVASLHSQPVGATFPAALFSMEGMAEPTSLNLQKIAWLAPASVGIEQVAVVGLGQRKDKVPYSEEELYWLEDIAQEIGEIIYAHDHSRSNTAQAIEAESSLPAVQADQLIDPVGLLSAFAYQPDLELVKWVEDGYRHLNDYTELGESPLVTLFGIQADDHLERGKLVHHRLIEILEKLRPAGQPPQEPVPSEWFAYTILHESYVQDRLSRDIMAKLYIGEGTYYRLRRQALRGITRAILEMGAVANLTGSG